MPKNLSKEQEITQEFSKLYDALCKEFNRSIVLDSRLEPDGKGNYITLLQIAVRKVDQNGR